jgi:hypothetical protein
MADETKSDQPPAVDETPISPSRPNAARKNSLQQHLLHRPERHELIESRSHATRLCFTNSYTDSIRPVLPRI